MPAGTYNIDIEQGIYFSVSFTIRDSGSNPIDVTNYTFRAEVRRESKSGLIKAFVITKINSVGGVIELSMSGTDTADLPVGKLKWDLIAKDHTNKVRRYLSGKVNITESISNTIFV